MKTVPISVVIPVFNGDRFIGEAIKSVQAQSYAVDEIIVVNNNSTDNSTRIAEDLGARVIHEKRQGLAIARNTGIKACRNDWVAFFDSDDVWDREKIEYQWKAIKRFPEARVISCGYVHFSDSDKSKDFTSEIIKPETRENGRIIFDDIFRYAPKYTPDLSEWFLIHISGLICHREVFAVAGLFDETFTYLEDLEFFFRALGRFPIASVDKILARIRVHDKNMSSHGEMMHKYRVLLIEKMLKFFDLYPPDLGNILLEDFKQSFVTGGAHLASKDETRIKNKQSKDSGFPKS